MDETVHNIVIRAQAFLFVEGGALSRKKLSQLVKCTEPQLREPLALLGHMLEGSGLSLIETEQEVSLAIAPSAAPAVRESLEHELTRDIGDAGLEVIAIVLYRGPSTRAQIDYIRGVNTSTTLRTLLVRGLVLRTNNPHDGREFLYSATAELMAHLGARSRGELPDYETIAAELASFEPKKTNDHD